MYPIAAGAGPEWILVARVGFSIRARKDPLLLRYKELDDRVAELSRLCKLGLRMRITVTVFNSSLAFLFMAKWNRSKSCPSTFHVGFTGFSAW